MYIADMQRERMKRIVFDFFYRRGLLQDEKEVTSPVTGNELVDFGVEGFNYHCGHGLFLDNYKISPVLCKLSDIAAWHDNKINGNSPIFIKRKRLFNDYKQGLDPVLYHAYRDIFPPRSKLKDQFETCYSALECQDASRYWYADFIEYQPGVLSNGEPYRSTGHWNTSAQVEVFQTIKGRIWMIIAGLDQNGKKITYYHICNPGDICLVPPGFWHLTYALDAPALVFNIYTDHTHRDADHSGREAALDNRLKYFSRAPLMVGLVHELETLQFIFSNQAAAYWGTSLPLLQCRSLLSLSKFDQSLLNFYLYARQADLFRLEEEAYSYG